jgi:methionyl-tRNA formyltransferase
LLVTSRITLVPNNYNDLILPLADCDEVVGLVVLDNLETTRAKEILGLALSGAKSAALNLVKNTLFSNMELRRQTYESKGKFFAVCHDVNDDKFIEIIKTHAIDLVVNARTRFIYRERTLTTPPLGCANIHHGLLPDQRGVMCDLWALANNQIPGFTIHKMNKKIDAGEILLAEKSNYSGKNYMDYLQSTARQEASALKSLLKRIAAEGFSFAVPNTKSEQTKYYRNPTFKDIRAMIKNGLGI